MILQADVLRIPLADKSVSLVFGSPPYEKARTYGIDFNLEGQAWVDWAVAGFMECLRVCRGLVAWNVEGQTRKFRYSATPALFMADLHRAGVHLRKPPIFKRVGIPGSGGPDWLRNDYEFIVCGTNGGKLPWSDNLANGEKCKFRPGGAMSNRRADGKRVDVITARKETRRHKYTYTEPDIANPGNIIDCKVGGGLMGSRIAHENEAPFSEKLPEFFIRSFCPPGGIVLDPFGGSGTTLAAATKWNRRGISCDIRWSQCELMKRRVSEVQLMLTV